MKDKFKTYFMKIAIETSNLSYCERSKVGAILVKNDSIISIGYNGTLPGYPNICEDKHNNTLPYVVHAEENCLMKVAKSTSSTEMSSIFVTLTPCINCAKLIINSGIKHLYYYNEYRDLSGLDLIRKNGIIVEQVNVV